MKILINYLLQVVIISGLLYGYYHFFLRNKKFHQYNRFYLLAVTVLSLSIPFLNIPVYFDTAGNDIQSTLVSLDVISISSLEEQSYALSVTNPAGTINWQLWFILIYSLISVLFLFRIFFSLSRIRRIIRDNEVQQLDVIHFVNTDEPGTPFSFFRWLFWNKNIEISSEKGQQILRHELFHINQKHSHDSLYLEILTVIFWINPFFYLLKKELKAIHEFLADRFAIREHRQADYAELLLMQALQTQLKLVHPFFHNQIKRRIAMITSSPKPGFQYLRKMMVLPLAVLILALFAFNYKSRNEIRSAENPITVVIDAGHGDHTGARINNIFEDDIVLSLARKVRALNTDENIRIILTREDNSNPSLADRKAIAEKNNADLLVSLHMSTSENAVALTHQDKNGIIFYIPSKKENEKSKLIATNLFNEFKKVYKTNDQLKQSEMSIYVLEKINIPAVLIECGNIADIDDHSFMTNENNQDKLAKSILQSIAAFSSGQNLNRSIPADSSANQAYNPRIKVDDLKTSKVHSLLGLNTDVRVSSFTFTIDLPNGTIASVPNEGNQFNEATLKLMREARAGRLITIDLIKIQENGQLKKIPSRIYYVVD